MSYKVKILNGVLKLKTFSDIVLNILGIKDLGTQTGEVTSGYIDWSMQQYTQTTAQWNASTYILLKGQVGVEDTGTTTFKLKVGDGVSTWQQLGYISGGGANDFPENLYLTVVNKTGDNLLATGYKVLKVQDAQGQRLAVDYALADSNGNSTDTIGVVYENIDNNQSGRIVVIGELTGLNTTGSLQGETWQDGDVLYLSSSTPGNLTKVQPIAPNHLVVVGYVVYAHANQGKIYCKVQNGWEIGELHDVYAPSPTHNDGIFWSSGTTRYENKSITTALGYTPENSANKGIANGYAPLGNDSKVDVAYLPSYVSDILEYANLAAFPVTGQTGKIYLALDTNKVYRWSGIVYIEVAANSGVWGAITGTITNQTDLQNALNLKYNIYYLGSSGLNLADSTTYYIGIVYYVLGTVEALKRFNFEKSETVKEIYLNSLHAGTASSENLTIYLRNSTTGVDNLIGTFKEDYPINSSKTFAFTGLNISVNSSDLYTIKLVTPSFAVNPTAVNYSIKIKTI